MTVIGGTYGEANWACVQCRGLTGAGDGSGAFPRLTGQSAWYLFKTLQDYAAGLRPNEAMQAVAGLLTCEQMRDVATWYASLEDVPYPAEVPEPKQDMVQLGAPIATAGIREQGVPACQGCHGPMGVGQPPLYPYLAGHGRGPGPVGHGGYAGRGRAQIRRCAACRTRAGAPGNDRPHEARRVHALRRGPPRPPAPAGCPRRPCRDGPRA
jgi:cytochrome c553